MVKMKGKLKDLMTRSGILFSLASMVLALILCAVVIGILGYSPLEAYRAMVKGAFGNSYNISQTIGIAVPLIFSGLSMAIASKVGVFNIGIEGQMLVGSFAAALAGYYIKGLPMFIHLPLSLLCGIMMGGLWALIAAELRNFLHINEVILTIMLNYVAQYVVSYMVNFPFKAEGNVVRTEYVQDSARLAILVPHTRLSSGIFLALIVAIVLAIVLKRTKFGYELRAVGTNPLAAQSAGINQKKYIRLAMFISGALAGLGGAGEVLGYCGYYIPSMTQGYGFDGIAIATMGQNNPIGTVVSAFLFGALRNGAAGMNQSTSIPGELIEVLEALIILFVSTPGIFKYIKKQMKARKAGK